MKLKGLFKGCLTIPNLLSMVRILLIPIFIVLFVKGYRFSALVVLALSGLTDLFDGKIARRYNQISALGKLLDPIADKLTQLSIAIILFWQFNTSGVNSLKLFSYVFLAFLGKELIMLLAGAIMLACGLRPCAAEVFGKVATFAFYMVMIVVVCFGPVVGVFIKWFMLPEWLVMALVVGSLILTIIALFSYVPDVWRQVKEKRANKKGENK